MFLMCDHWYLVLQNRKIYLCSLTSWVTCLITWFMKKMWILERLQPPYTILISAELGSSLWFSSFSLYFATDLPVSESWSCLLIPAVFDKLIVTSIPSPTSRMPMKGLLVLDGMSDPFGEISVFSLCIISLQHHVLFEASFVQVVLDRRTIILWFIRQSVWRRNSWV